MYLRPGKRWEESRDRVWEAYVRGVRKFRGKGRIVVLTDANVRIGETESQIGGHVYERKSEDKKVEAAGREFVEKSDELGMGILNGLRGKVAKCTSFHRSGVGQSMIDFICVEEERIDEWGEVERGSFGEGESDHEVVMVQWKGTVRQGKREQKGAEESRGGKGAQKIGKLDVSKVKGNRWCKLEERGGRMGEWQEWLWEEGKEEGIDMVYAEWLRKVKEVVEGGGGEEGEREKGRQEEWRVWGRDLERARKAKIRARRRWVEMEDGGRKEKAKEEWKEMRRKMKRLVRKERVSDTLERMQRIERLGSKEPKWT
jgi:hypothetical protein